MRVAEIERLIEPELVGEGGDCLGRRGRTQNGLGRIARQYVHDRKHDQGRCYKRGRQNSEPLEKVEKHCGTLERRAKLGQVPHELFAASAEASRSEISDESARAMRISASRAARRSE